jgi:2',3'-cyclic-nucleotide 2'-phosphodiesterase (5'-nucleotidase family)
LIVGGHSHTLLGNFTGSMGPYPTIAQNLDNEEVFVVTSYRWGEILGKMSIAFDPSGKIVSYEGEPLRLTNTTAQDQKLQNEVNEWRQPFDAMAQMVVGNSSVLLDQSTCQLTECEH